MGRKVHCTDGGLASTNTALNISSLGHAGSRRIHPSTQELRQEDCEFQSYVARPVNEKQTCVSCLSVTVMDHDVQKQLMEERVDLGLWIQKGKSPLWQEGVAATGKYSGRKGRQLHCTLLTDKSCNTRVYFPLSLLVPLVFV